ncbi:S8 family peptidase [Streptomyces chartreusis]|uniref:S8 family peptidase n=1 Tax=Streptomyces chartreusis TaxID=1969 RepID=UPI003D8B6DA4
MTVGATRLSKLTWSLQDRNPGDILVSAAPIPEMATVLADRNATGRGIRVCVVDSGIEGDHPAVGPVGSSWAVMKEGGNIRVEKCNAGDICGHGTACAGIIRKLAPECELHSVRVLGKLYSGTADVLLEGLRWSIQQRFDVINLSLSTTRFRFAEELRALADEAYFNGTLIVASAHNTPVESFPWRFASVVSVGSHQEDAAELFLYNPRPPVEFFAPGRDLEVAWLGGEFIRATGNSFAAPFIAGLAARILSHQPHLTPFQLKTVLYLSAANVSVSPVSTVTTAADR